MPFKLLLCSPGRQLMFLTPYGKAPNPPGFTIESPTLAVRENLGSVDLGGTEMTRRQQAVL